MEKNAIKKYAVWARNELIARVTQKAEQYEITEKKTTPKDTESIGGKLLTESLKNQRRALIEKIEVAGFEQVMEEVAYTWFNRFTALRFMEVNNYLPSHTRVFTNENGEFKPQILTDAIQLDLEGLNMDKVFELKDANKTEELYKYLLITQCNALSGILPRMFQKIEHYTEMLLPDYLLREGSVIEQMITLIPEEDWTDQVQIIGWLYQYYNSEPKDAVFATLKKNVKISKENIPAATQLFTPDWIVRYMVENSLGRMWVEGHPNDALKKEWKYFLDEAEQEANVQKQLDEIRKEYAVLKPKEIRCIDPCMGSGHILCYMFDVLVKIYEDYGYTAREAVENIVEKNLWGLDIDERAAQLSYFAVMMKARRYDRRFLSKKNENGELCIPQPHVYAIEESNGITYASMHDMGVGLSQEEYGRAVKESMRLVEEMHDAKEYGSIIRVTPCDWNLLRRFAVPRWISEGQMRMDIHGEIEASERLQVLINIGEALSQKYHAIVTNPPYMGSGGMSNKLSDYVKKYYPDNKSDLFAVFIEKCSQMPVPYGFQAMITQHAWMFLASFEKLRTALESVDIINMAHLGPRAFEDISGEVVQTTTFVLRKSNVENYRGTYSRLIEANSQSAKEKMFLDGANRFTARQNDYYKIPGSPIAYWVSKQLMDCYDHPLISSIAFSDGQILTGNNDKYLRLIWEVEREKIENKKWALHAKGGEFRRWYGNIDTVVKFDPATIAHYKKDKISRFPKKEILFRRGITWTLVSMNPNFGVRELDETVTFNKAAATILFNDKRLIDYVLGFLNTKVAQALLRVINPTMNNNIKDVLNMPFIMNKNQQIPVEKLVKECISLSKDDWDSFETSWDFARHPLIPAVCSSELLIENVYSKWVNICEDRFYALKSKEEELNRIFIKIYGLENELIPDVDDKDVTVNKANSKRDVKSLIAYAVGCMFGRYSLDVDGIAFAGGDWDEKKYKSFIPDKDGIIPICDDEYFEDDIVCLFESFVEKVYGKTTLEENLQFIAQSIGGKGTSREIIRNYFINEFYNDHVKRYQKRPIYWMFDSGKKNGFKCLIYMHRYRSDTIARIRTDYVHELQSRYRTAISDIENRFNRASTSDRVKLNKKLTRLQAQAIEIREFEERVHHLADQMITIDLDDGVKRNYTIFKNVLSKI